ncbi:radical SAM/SPASM domain-containing protein [Planctomycetota bacterium]
MSILRNIQHLRNISSVDWRSLAKTIVNLYPDYYSGKGRSNSIANITLEITYKCNWKCNFCFLKDNVLNQEMDELSYNEIVKLIDEVAPKHIGFFLTGGEPFTRPDCIDIIGAIKERGLKVGVNTNSHLLNEAKIDQLNEIGLDYLITSIHGPREIHDAITGVKSFDRIMQNLSYWQGKSGRTKILINFVTSPQTYRHMSQMVAIAAEVGVDALTIQHETYLTPHDRAEHDRQWLQIFGRENEVELGNLDLPTDEFDLPAMTEMIAGARKKAKELGLNTFFKPDLDSKGLENWYGLEFRANRHCSYIYSDARINPRGDVVVCQFIPKVVGNIRSGKLLELVNSEPFIEFRKGIKQAGGLFGACARCCKLYRTF